MPRRRARIKTANSSTRGDRRRPPADRSIAVGRPLGEPQPGRAASAPAARRSSGWIQLSTRVTPRRHARSSSSAGSPSDARAGQCLLGSRRVASATYQTSSGSITNPLRPRQPPQRRPGLAPSSPTAPMPSRAPASASKTSDSSSARSLCSIAWISPFSSPAMNSKSTRRTMSCSRRAP